MEDLTGTATAQPGGPAPPVTGPDAGRQGRPDPPRVRGRWWWAAWFLALAGPVALFFAVAVPPMQPLDADSHLRRIDGISRGLLGTGVGDDGRAEIVSDGCVEAFIDHHMARGLAAGPMSFSANWRSVRCMPDRRITLARSAVNSPLSYLPGVLGYATARALGAGVAHRVLAARLVAVLAYLLTVAAALAVAPRGRGALFVVAALPSSVALAAAASPDLMAIGLAVLAVALTLRLRDEPVPDPAAVDGDARAHGAGVDARRVAGLAALAVALAALAVSKNTYGPFVLLLALVPRSAFRSARGHLAYVAGAFAAVVGVALAWAARATRVVYDIPQFRIDSVAQRVWIQHHPLGFLAAAARGFGSPFFRREMVPEVVEVMAGLRPSKTHSLVGDLAPWPLVVLAVALLLAGLRADRGGRWAGLARAAHLAGGDGDGGNGLRGAPVVPILSGAAIGLCCALLIAYGVALNSAPPGADRVVWMQGRYFLPLLALLALAAPAPRRAGLPPAPARLSTAPGAAARVERWLPGAVVATSALLLAWVVVRVFVLFY